LIPRIIFFFEKVIISIKRREKFSKLQNNIYYLTFTLLLIPRIIFFFEEVIISVKKERKVL
jgi:hypothetical protein